MINFLDKIFRFMFGLQNIIECSCGQINDKSKNSYCINCEQPLK